MKKEVYSAPKVRTVLLRADRAYLITSGYDQFHSGGGGYYGLLDLYDNGEY